MKRLALAAAAVLAAMAVTVIMLRTSPTPGSASHDGTSRARAACADLAQAEQLVRDNGSGEAVLRSLGRAKEHAVAAQGFDVHWVQLASAVAALRHGFKEDDANAVRVGLRISRRICVGLADEAVTRPSPDDATKERS